MYCHLNFSIWTKPSYFWYSDWESCTQGVEKVLDWQYASLKFISLVFKINSICMLGKQLIDMKLLL